MNGRPPESGFLTEAGWKDARALERLIAQPPHSAPLAAFDFDDTVIDGDLSLTLLDHLDPTGRERAAYDEDCARDVRSGYAKLTETLIAGKTEVQVRAETRAALQAGLASGRIRFRAAIAELIWALQRHGWEVFVVTASPAVAIGVAAQQVGVPADHVLGMWCEVDPDGRFVAPTRDPITYRIGKVEALRQRTERPLTLAVGDALTDFELLKEAHAAIVVDKGVPELRAAAGERGWFVEEGL